jgi:hypothetical protein
VDHPGAGSAAWNSRHVEKRDDAAGSAALVAVGDVTHLRVVRVHSLPYQSQSKQSAVEIKVCLDIGCDRSDVV